MIVLEKDAGPLQETSLPGLTWGQSRSPGTGQWASPGGSAPVPVQTGRWERTACQAGTWA